jgi:hypothetical protein
MTSCVARSDARPSRSTAPVTFQPSVPPSRWGCLFPLGPATTGRLVEAPGPARIAPLCESSQAAPGFPGLPRRGFEPPHPTWRACPAAHEKGRPVGPPPTLTTCVPGRSIKVATTDESRAARTDT